MGLPDHLAGLSSPAAYPHAVNGVKLVETNIAWVLLTGELAYKIKRPVKLAFLDIRSSERRKFLCEEEVRLNRRFAPSFIGVSCRLPQAPMAHASAGTEEVIEHAVCMRQFESADQLDHLLERGGVSLEDMSVFGRTLGAIHEQLPRVVSADSFGTSSAVKTGVLENLRQCVQISGRVRAQADVRSLEPLFVRRLAALERDIDARREAGKVRECHGDLHSGNVARYGGRLIAFDCLEFEPAFRWIDVAEEIAFLYMDVVTQSHQSHATAFLNGWLAQTGDYGACRLLGLYAAHRAVVRAKVAALRSENDSYASYVRATRRFLESAQPRLVLMRGLSGSGKSWLASRLAPELGAVLVRSDVERKRMAGLAEVSSSASGLQSGLYSPDSTARLYGRLAECARDVLSGGLSVIVDATFLMRRDRALLSAVAAECHASVTLIDCVAPDAVLESRIQSRAAEAKDASEADLSVLRWQQVNAEPLSDDESLDVLTADTTRDLLDQELPWHL